MPKQYKIRRGYSAAVAAIAVAGLRAWAGTPDYTRIPAEGLQAFVCLDRQGVITAEYESTGKHEGKQKRENMFEGAQIVVPTSSIVTDYGELLRTSDEDIEEKRVIRFCQSQPLAALKKLEDGSSKVLIDYDVFELLSRADKDALGQDLLFLDHQELSVVGEKQREGYVRRFLEQSRDKQVVGKRLVLEPARKR